MKNILIPFDFSRPALEAVKSAVVLATTIKGTVTLVYPFILAFANESMVTTRTSQLSGRSLVSEGKQLIEARITRLKEKFKNRGCKLDHVITMGHDLAALRRLILSRHVDLIVMANNRSGIDGTTQWNTQDIIRTARVPVLLIRKAGNFSAIRQILFPCTLESYLPRIVRQLKEIQQTFKATLHLLLVNTPDHFMTDEMAQSRFGKFLKHYGTANSQTHFYCDISEAEGIRRFANKMKVDMIVMPTHARKGLSRAVHGSVMERVLADMKAPLVAIAM